MSQASVNPPWFVRKDLDGFFGLMIDNLIQLILIVILCRELILQAREGVARAVDSGPTTLYWPVGRRVRRDILKERRADCSPRWGDNWRLSSVAALEKRTCAGWCNSRNNSPTFRLSRHCCDN